ncbi:MAG: type IV pilus assembly protein PilM [Candidatus Eisenbacteria sp.]|nr:type IV pilus assembly protein PilM [Candidatus Eisenbacteria bacterium]
MVFTRERTRVGLDIGASSIKVVELERLEAGVRLVRFGEVELPPDVIVDGEIMDRQRVVEAIRELLASSGISRRRVVTGVHGRGVIVKKIAMDRMEPEDASEAIFWEAEQHVPYDLNDVSLDFQILDVDMGPQQMQVLLVAAKRDLVLNRAEIIREAGLVVEAVDINSFAALNALEAAGICQPGEVVALLNVGADITNVNVIRDGIPLYTQDLSLGGNSFLQAIQKAHILSRDEALQALQANPPEVDLQGPLEEFAANLSGSLDKSLHYLRSSGEADQIDRILVSGGGALIRGIVEVLGERQAATVSILDPLQHLDRGRASSASSADNGVSSQLAVGIGLALRKE